MNQMLTGVFLSLVMSVPSLSAAANLLSPGWQVLQQAPLQLCPQLDAAQMLALQQEKASLALTVIEYQPDPAQSSRFHLQWLGKSGRAEMLTVFAVHPEQAFPAPATEGGTLPQVHRFAFSFKKFPQALQEDKLCLQLSFAADGRYTGQARAKVGLEFFPAF